MSTLSYKVNKFDFTDASQNTVAVNLDVSSQAPPGTIVFLFAAVGAETPVLVAQGSSGHLDTKIGIAKTKGLVGGGPGNKPVALIVYSAWVYNEQQARAWIQANAAEFASAATIYLK